MKNHLDRLSIGKKNGGGRSKSLTLILFLLFGLLGFSGQVWAGVC